MHQAPVIDTATLEPRTAQEWTAFIKAEVEATDTAYLSKPNFLLGHGRGERGATSDYAGRELLELVQNAADAAAETGRPGRVHIEVTSQGLVVANTGQPFRMGGVRSLMAANTSDKPGRAVRMIGAKGLGFRSLLNWSHEPFISSGALEIAFSREHANAHARALSTRSGELAALLDGADPVVPVLAFPMVGEHAAAQHPETMAPLVSRAKALRQDGYDTVVVARFDTPAALQQAITQADEFKPQFLLFVPSLQELTLLVSGRAPIRWTRRSGESDRLHLEVAQGEARHEQSWTCRRRTGQVKDAGGAAWGYEMAVAIPDTTTATGCLHAYFPTDVPVPFPALFHATLELDSNRKALNANSLINRAVLEKLATFYAETVALYTKARSHEPLTLLARQALFPPLLQPFEAAVYRAAAKLKIIRTMSGGRVTARDTSIGPKGYETFFPRKLFGELAYCRNDADRGVLERLGVKAFDTRKALTKLRSAELSLKERAAVVVGVTLNLPRDLHDRRLLIDSDGRTLGVNNTCFTDPASRRPPSLPSWARAKFMHPELWRLISAGLQGPPRARIVQLVGFGVHEFNADGVITSLRAQAAQVLDRGRVDADKVRTELLQAIFTLFPSDGRQIAYPPGRLDVRCADGKWRSARDVHLSAPYGDSGLVVSALYNQRPDLLLGSPEANGFSGSEQNLEAFFSWIGVNRWPRKTTQQHVQGPLWSALIQSLPETFDVSDGTYQDIIHRDNLKPFDATAASDSVEGLDGILKTAPSEAILAWLARDPRMSAPFETRLSARTGRKQMRRYQGPLLDLVRHRLATTAWLEVRDGKRAAPRQTMLSPGRLSELFPTPVAPRSGNPFNLDRDTWLRGLHIAGAPTSLADLSEARIFDLLGGLEARGASTELVRRLYGQVLELDDFDPNRAPLEAARFFGTGRLQVRQGANVGWADVGETFYLDRDNIPAAAQDLVPLIDLPSRRNAQDILARFGAAPLSRQKLQMTVVERRDEGGAIAGVLGRLWHATLPFIRAHRRAANSDAIALRPLDRLQLVVCTHALIQITLGQETRTAPLEPWKQVIADDNLLIVVDPIADENEIIFLAAEVIGDGVAERLGLQAGPDFTRLLSAPNDTVRAVQLRRMLTHRSAEEIDALMQELEPEPVEPPHQIDAETLERALKPTASSAPSPTQGGAPVTVPSSPGATSTPTLTSTSAPVSPPAPPLRPPVVGVTAAPQEAKPISSGAGGGGSAWRIGGTTGPLGAPRDPDRPADAEAWAEFFETSEGRFPLVVARLQGKGAFGCDLLSFATSEDRDGFKLEPSRVELIARYIEVKSGSVRLVTNEIDAAARLGERYFVYRIQFDGEGRDSANLSVLADPLSHRHALAKECEVRIDEIAASLHLKLRAVRAA